MGVPKVEEHPAGQMPPPGFEAFDDLEAIRFKGTDSKELNELLSGARIVGVQGLHEIYRLFPERDEMRTREVGVMIYATLNSGERVAVDIEWCDDVEEEASPLNPNKFWCTLAKI